MRVCVCVCVLSGPWSSGLLITLYILTSGRPHTRGFALYYYTVIFLICNFLLLQVLFLLLNDLCM